MKSIFDIHKKLGLILEKDDGTTVVKDGLFKRIDQKKTRTLGIFHLYNGSVSNYKSNIRAEYTLKKINPHSFFLFNNEPLLLFFDNPPNMQELSANIWNFNKSALIFVNTPKELVIYNGFNYDKDKGLLTVLNTIKKVSDYAKLEQYSYWKIVTAELWNAKDKIFKKNTRVDKKLLDNIKTARNILLGKDKNQKIKKPLHEKHANRIIGRLIFIRYLIDRGVNFDYEKEGAELLENKEAFPSLILQKNNLFNFFEYLLSKFNGNMLPLNGERDAVENEHLVILAELFAGGNIKARQRSFFNIFDFDFIPIELISNIYETFLSEIQDRDKAFYTPPFLVDYVLSQTVKPFLEKLHNSNEISCKTADMTCGSGIFLCETLRSVINKYIELAKPDISSDKFKKKIKQLLKDNIFGNDINEEATEIAKFSLFITFLDYFEDPKDIENFEFPDVKENFYNEDVFGYFNKDENFKDKLGNIFGKGKKHELDFIIGNPPWGKLQKESKYIEYCKFRENKENKNRKELWLKENENLKDFKPIEIKIANNEFAQAFLLRLSDFSTEKTENQVIVTSKLLYNLQAVKFRNYFLNNFLINEVLEISSVRHQIFANAVGPAAIIKYKYAFGKDTRKNTVDYVSLKPNPYFAIFKTILIEKYDYKEVLQKELIDNDWLWKVLVYGHILDYHFIKRLRNKNQFPVTLGSLIEDKDNKDRPLFASTGIKIGDKNKVNDVSRYKGMYFLETDTKKTKRSSDLQSFFSYFHKNNIWKEEKADGIRNERVFSKPPALLIKIGFTTDFKIVSSVTHIACVFTNSIYAIKSKNRDNKVLENLLGLVSSNLMTFYMIMKGSSTGVEREQLINKELYPFPIIENDKISNLSKELIKIKRLLKIYEHITVADSKENINIKKEKYKRLFVDTEKKLNKTIFNLYNLSETERNLIDYTQNITIPILKAKKKDFRDIKSDVKLYKPYKRVSENEIENYINIFKEHFAKTHNGGKNGYINVRIFQSTNILAIEFYIDDKQYENIWNNEPDNEKALEIMASAGFQKVSNELFIQKDVKVLRSNSFSVLKLNQYKYWHKAVASLDLNEFVDAMIKSQMKPQKKSTNA